jgi:N-acetylglucosamine-6-phosphate deacetylase
MEGNRVELRDGALRVMGSGLLSGAARTLAQDVEWLARQPEPGIEAALLMATRNPAEAMGDASWADLRPGRQGPLAVFSWNGERLGLEERIGF